jgi:protein SCO1
MIALALLFIILLNANASAAAPDLSAFSYDQRPGSQLPLDERFTDEQGRTLTLRETTNQRPTILALGYFRCPNLCGLVRNDLMHALSRLAQPPNYGLVVLSIDPSETQADARSARAADIARFEHPDQTGSWHYVTGSSAAIRAVTDAVGFRSRFDGSDKQFLHPAGIVFLTGSGTVSSYLLGLGYQPSDVGLGIARAANGVTARALPILLLCFHYDQATGRYTLAVTRVLRLAGAITILVLGGTVLLALRRERRLR